MSGNGASEGPRSDHVPFACDWRKEAPHAASVRVAGEVDIATTPQLAQVLHAALQHARLVVLDARELTFMDGSGLHVVLDAVQRARETGARLVLATMPRKIDALLELTRMRNLVDVLADPIATGSLREAPTGLPVHLALVVERDETETGRRESAINPLENPVNANVITARVMAVPGRALWFQGPDSTIGHAWLPRTAELPAPATIEVYLGPQGTVNGWRDPNSGLAINQRLLPAGAEPSTASPLACQGPCGIVWQAPAAAQLIEHDEHCLTCAGPLAR